jgi:hypothetical protein
MEGRKWDGGADDGGCVVYRSITSNSLIAIDATKATRK